MAKKDKEQELVQPVKSSKTKFFVVSSKSSLVVKGSILNAGDKVHKDDFKNETVFMNLCEKGYISEQD